MDQQKMLLLQQKLIEFQQNLIETTVSENNEMQVTVNGKLEIIDLRINTILPANELENILKGTINKAIAGVSLKIQQAMQLYAQ